MSTLVTERDVFAESVQFSEDSMTVSLDDEAMRPYHGGLRSDSEPP